MKLKPLLQKNIGIRLTLPLFLFFLTFQVFGQSISGFTPAAVTPGHVVSISGNGFTGVTQVNFNTAPALAFTVESDSLITATVPYSAASGTISVITPADTASSASPLMIISNPATISFFTDYVCIGKMINLGTSSMNTAGAALHLNGAGNYVNVPGFRFNSDGGAVTIEFWTKARVTPGKSSSIFSINTSDGLRFQAHVPAADSMLHFDYGSHNNSPVTGRISANYTSFIDEWTHVALVSEGKGGNFRAIYINGNEVAKITNVPSDGADTRNMAGLKIGSSDSENNHHGLVDEFRIWNRVRTPNEIRGNMYTSLKPNTPNLVGYWRFDEFTGTKTADASGNNFHGTFVADTAANFPSWQASGIRLQPYYEWSPSTYLDSTLGSSVNYSYPVTNYTSPIAYVILNATYPDGYTSTDSMKIYNATYGTWMGDISPDWFNSENWCGGVPTAITDVLIPERALNMPLLSDTTGKTIQVRNLRINYGATLGIGSGNLQVLADLTNNGSYNQWNGSLTLNNKFDGSGNFSQMGGIINFSSNNSNTIQLPVTHFHALKLNKGQYFHLYNITIDSLLILSGKVDLNSAFTSKIILKGDLQVEDSVKGAGKIVMQDGTKTHAIHANAAVLPYLELNDPQGAVMQTDLTISKALTFRDGILDGNGNTLTIADSIKNESSTSYYRGELRKTTAISGTGTHTFGNIGVEFKNTGGGNWGNVTVTRTTGIPARNLGDSTKTSILRTWEITPATQAGTTVDLTLTWLTSEDNGKDFSSGSGFVWKDSGSGWKLIGEAIDIETDGDTRTLTVSTNSFSTVTISDINSPLPVTWLSFNAARTTAGTALSWSTASENNSSRFAIERSTDGKTFTTIAEVAAAGNSKNTRNYSFTDAQAPATTAYYRLQQFDQNGEYAYSKIIAVDGRKQLAFATEVFPNPLREELHLKLAQPLTSPATAELQDLTGRTLSRFSLTNNTASQTLQLPALAQGIYLLRLTIESQVQVIKLMKE